MSVEGFSRLNVNKTNAFNSQLNAGSRRGKIYTLADLPPISNRGGESQEIAELSARVDSAFRDLEILKEQRAQLLNSDLPRIPRSNQEIDEVIAESDDVLKELKKTIEKSRGKIEKIDSFRLFSLNFKRCKCVLYVIGLFASFRLISFLVKSPYQTTVAFSKIKGDL